jgi:hypothetical protein
MKAATITGYKEGGRIAVPKRVAKNIGFRIDKLPPKRLHSQQRMLSLNFSFGKDRTAAPNYGEINGQAKG